MGEKSITLLDFPSSPARPSATSSKRKKKKKETTTPEW